MLLSQPHLDAAGRLMHAVDSSELGPCTQVRDKYPVGGLVINEDLAVYDISKEGVRHRKRIVPERSWGFWHAESNWNSLEAGQQQFAALYK